MALRVKFLLAVLTLATVLLAGCGGQDTPVEQQEEEVGLEEVVEEETTPYQAPPRDAEEATADEVKQKAAAEGVKANPSGAAKEQAAVEDLDPITELLACASQARWG